MRVTAKVRRLGAIVATLVPALAFAHAKWISPAPRTENDNIKTPPCQGVMRTASPATFTAGATINVSYTERIHHLGWYEVNFSQAGDTNWAPVGLPDGGLANRIPNPLGVQATSGLTIVLPNTPCEACTLQLIQTMFWPDGGVMFGHYYSCADIRLVAPPDAGSPDGGAGGGGAAGGSEVGSGGGGEVGAAGGGEVGAAGGGEVGTAGGGEVEGQEGGGGAVGGKQHIVGGCGLSSTGSVFGGLLGLLASLRLLRRRS